jgi:hypothetical protein
MQSIKIAAYVCLASLTAVVCRMAGFVVGTRVHVSNDLPYSAVMFDSPSHNDCVEHVARLAEEPWRESNSSREG